MPLMDIHVIQILKDGTVHYFVLKIIFLQRWIYIFFFNPLTLFEVCDLNCFFFLNISSSMLLGLFSLPYLFIPFADVSYFSYSWPPRALSSFFISHLLQVKASHSCLQSFLFFCLKNDKLLQCQLSWLNARRLSCRPDSLLLSKCRSE